MNTTTDTIVATATPPGYGGVAIVRVSGPNVLFIINKITQKQLKPRYATYVNFYAKNNEIIDQGIAIFFPNPNSFTGEDILELQIHGSPIVANKLIEEIISLNARLAKPGEFSERAFLNNRIDLIQAEAIADLINSSSEQAAKNALNSLQGVFSKKIEDLLKNLIQLRLMIEAEIDFTEEEIDFLDNKIIEKKLLDLLLELKNIQKTAKQGSLLSEGINIVISGEPNVGKSSLLNALSNKDSAIVTNIPGTTRDILREKIQIDGLPIHLIDTAGLRESDDPIEQEGIRRARIEIDKADLVLIILDASKNIEITNDNIQNNIKLNKNKKYIFIRNKIDLTNENPSIITKNNYSIISISVKNNIGLELLTKHIKHLSGLSDNQEGIFSARQRHLDALSRAEEFISLGLKNISNITRELLADDLMFAQNSINEITGEFTTDDLLGKIFSSFCIGK